MDSGKCCGQQAIYASSMRRSFALLGAVRGSLPASCWDPSDAREPGANGNGLQISSILAAGTITTATRVPLMDARIRVTTTTAA